jgi:vacuolar-type H+-ATPase subunit H
MDKTKIRIILVLVCSLLFSLALFGVLYAEEAKNISRREESLQNFLSQLREGDRARKEYYEAIAKQKEDLRRQMADTEKAYQNLLVEQPDIVAGKKQQVTQVTERVVPVTTQQTVSVSKPKSTKSTKTS